MGFYYALEKKRFDEKWEQIRKEYEKAGMDPKDIDSMRTFDWKVFLSRRNYDNHTQALPESLCGSCEDGRSTLFQKYPSLSVTFDVDDFTGRYTWIDTIGDVRLSAKLAQLSSKDLELLTALVLEGCDQKELALRWGCTQSAVSQHFKKLKKFLASPGRR